MEKFVAKIENAKKSSPLLYGLFFEDINHGLDGGLNANLIQNGFFDFCYFNYNSINLQKVFDNLRFWKCDPLKYFSITSKHPLHENNPFSLRVELKDGDGDAVFQNLGYEINRNQNFLLLKSANAECSFFYSADKDFSFKCFFEYENGEKSKPVEMLLKKTKNFRQVSFNLSGQKGSYAKIVFVASGVVTAYFTGFRLIPDNYFRSKNAYKFGKFNAALVNALNMGAKFLRFPGGCLVEGDISTDNLFEWEKTIGPLETRVTKPSVWNYAQTNEIGFFEYFCLCEDLNLEPVPVHHLGLICQIRTEVFRHQGFIALDPKSAEFKKKVTDSVAHLIFFAKGSTSSADKTEREWALKRKSMGHTHPFRLNMIALGNENWGNVYFRNFNAALEGLKNFSYCGKKVNLLEKFQIQILSSAGVDINPQDTNPSWKYISKHFSNLLVDEHCYNTPDWFVDNFSRYDFYDPNTSKVFMGEYACHTDADGKGRLGGKNSFRSALCEAVFQCGMENNPDVVKMSCYAPLFCKKNQANWDPDLIYFDGDKVFPTVNHSAQKLFMQNRGYNTIKLENLTARQNFSGQFTIKTNKNVLKKIAVNENEKFPMQIGIFDTLESSTELENFCAEIEFKELKDSFTIGLGVKHHENFGFFLHYDFSKKELFYEKIVNGFRMTLESLAKVELQKKFCIKFFENKIQLSVKNEKSPKVKEKIVAQKTVWKTASKIFTNLTFDEKNIFLKVVNISDDEETASFHLDEKLFFKKLTNIPAKMTSLTEHPYDEMSAVSKNVSFKLSSNNFSQKFLPKSINVLTIKR